MRQAMNRSTAVRSVPKLTGLGSQSQRWRSYDKSKLTTEALEQKVQAGLGDDEYGRALRLNADAKTISTAVGDLPISPLFDPQWMKARRRQKKDLPSKPSGRFRTKLANNPFARALATPIRWSANTTARLPRYFLQDFESVQHPATGQPWVAPGPLSFAFPQKTDSTVNHQGGDPNAVASEAKSDEAEIQEQHRRRPSPVTGYTLCQKDFIDSIGRSKKPAGGLFLMRNGMAAAPDSLRATYRKDMGDLLLKMMRGSAVDELIRRSTRNEETKHMFVEPCQTWDAIKDVKLRGCVLWQPQQDDAVTKYATYDVEEASYGKKMPVHNLRWLLGEDEVARLQAASDIFRDNEIIVLKQWPRPGMMQLHLLLWRLQGYLSPPDSNTTKP